MQSLASVATPAAASRTGRQSDSQRLRSVVGEALAAPRRPQRRARPVAAAAALSLYDSTPLVLQLLPAAAWTLVGVMALRVFMGDQQAQEEPQRECEVCGGTGMVECWCSRWSDGDGGCSTCRGSGRMVCSSCRGGGTAVPIKARIYIDNQRTDNFKQGR